MRKLYIDVRIYRDTGHLLKKINGIRDIQKEILRYRISRLSLFKIIKWCKVGLSINFEGKNNESINLPMRSFAFCIKH